MITSESFKYFYHLHYITTSKQLGKQKMNRENCLRKPRQKGGKRKVISMRISQELSDWLYSQNLSPRGILIEGSKELGFKPQK